MSIGHALLQSTPRVVDISEIGLIDAELGKSLRSHEHER